jgi:hypothetical protein
MSPVETTDSFLVGKSKATLINASPTSPAKISNGHGGKLFYKTTAAVSVSDTEVAVGSSVTVEQIVWVISESQSKITVEHQAVSNPAGGNASPTAIPGFYTWQPTAATSGTDTTPAEKKLFVSSLFLPVNKTVKGIGYLVGSVGGTNKVVAGLFNSAGELLAHSSETTEGATVGTAAEIQELDLTATYKATGPGLYFVGITMNGNTARLRSIPKNTAGANVFTSEATLTTKNVLAKITAPTSFTADKGPVAWVY